MEFFQINAQGLSVILSTIACLVAGVIVYRRDPKNQSLIFYALLSLTVALWSLSEVVVRSVHTSRDLWMHFTILTSILMVQSLFFFSITFALKKRLSVSMALFLSAPAPLLVLAGFFGTVSLNQYQDYFQVFRSITGQIPYLVFTQFFYAVWSLASVIILYKKFHEEAGVFREKNRKISIIIFCAVFIGLSVNVFLPQLGVDQLHFIGRDIIALSVLYFGHLIASYYLWNRRIFWAEFFLIFISVTLLGNLFFSDTSQEFLIKFLFLLLSTGASYFLLKNVKTESESEHRVEQLIKELSERNRDLSTLNRRNSAFITATANQLLDPLMRVRGQASSVLSGAFGQIPEASGEYVERILASSKRLIAIVDDFLDLRKIEQRSMEYTFNFFEMKSMVKSLYEEMLPFAGEKKIQLSYADDGRESYILCGDEGKLRQVISNLIDNAIKYTNEGRVGISLEKEGEVIRVHIKDSGIGLTEKEIHRLFNKFFRTAKAKKTNTGGSGLGLYVAKNIISAHDGGIWVKSNGHDLGSVFTVELPIENKKSEKEN